MQQYLVVETKLDLRAGYHQVKIRDVYTSRMTLLSRWGLFEYEVMPFGQVNARATFYHLMNYVVREGLERFATVYLGDILIFFRSVEEHEGHLQWVLDRLCEHGLQAKCSKYTFAADSVEYLGYVVSKEGIKPDQAKVQVVRVWPVPTCTRDLQYFLGLANYYP